MKMQELVSIENDGVLSMSVESWEGWMVLVDVSMDTWIHGEESIMVAARGRSRCMLCYGRYRCVQQQHKHPRVALPRPYGPAHGLLLFYPGTNPHHHDCTRTSV